MTYTPDAQPAAEAPAATPTCGIVMPISAIDGCTAEHWQDVHAILATAIRAAGFEPNLVSDANEVGVIQKRIVENLYTNPIVVCDVSGKNANVMLELGMRLAFDKPVVIVQDDKTSTSFDTGPIEYLPYPRDLRHNKIEAFKEKLAFKLKATVEASSDPKYTTFLKHFGTFSVAKVETKEVALNEFMLLRLQELTNAVNQISLGRGSANQPQHVKKRLPPKFRVVLKETSPPLDPSNLLLTADATCEVSFDSGHDFVISTSSCNTQEELWRLLWKSGLQPSTIAFG